MYKNCLRIAIHTRIDQKVDNPENVVPKIRDAVGAHSAQTTIVVPDTVCM